MYLLSLGENGSTSSSLFFLHTPNTCDVVSSAALKFLWLRPIEQADNLSVELTNHQPYVVGHIQTTAVFDSLKQVLKTMN